MEITGIRVKAICRAEKKKSEYIALVCSDAACERCKGTGSYETWATAEEIYALFEDTVRYMVDDRIEKERDRNL